MSFQSAKDALAAGISKAEGYGVANAVPTITNNPGDLKIGDVGYGTTSNGITIFGSYSDGYAALQNQVNKMLGGTSKVYSTDMTLSQVGDIYSGSKNGNWANNVANSLGTSTDTTLGDLANGNSSSSASNTAGSSITDSSDSDDTSSFTFLGMDVSRGVAVILGMIIIAAGLFSFKETQTVITATGKHLAKGAELLA